MPDRDLILVLGAGRSGTSALTRVLSLCGCVLPHNVSGASDANPKGFWEPVDALRVNYAFLVRHGSGNLDPTMRIQELTIGADEREEFIGEIQAFLASSPSGSTLLVKEPAIAEVMELWLEATRREGFSAKVVVPIRHPEEVFASYAEVFGAKFKVSVELANAFWIKRNLLSERLSRGLPRVFVDYKNLLNDWRREAARIAKALSVSLSPDSIAVDQFINRELHRQRHTGEISETFAHRWNARIYQIFFSAAQDGPVDLGVLDEIYDAYRADERAFRIAYDNFGEYLNFSASVRKLYSGVSERAAAVPVWRSGYDF